MYKESPHSNKGGEKGEKRVGVRFMLSVEKK